MAFIWEGSAGGVGYVAHRVFLPTLAARAYGLFHSLEVETSDCDLSMACFDYRRYSVQGRAFLCSRTPSNPLNKILGYN